MKRLYKYSLNQNVQPNHILLFTLVPPAQVRPRVPAEAVLEAFAAEADVQDFYSSAIEAKTVGKKSVKLVTFPPLPAHTAAEVHHRRLLAAGQA